MENKEKGRIEIIFFDNEDITFKVTQLNKIEVIGLLVLFLEEQKKELKPKTNE